MDKEAERQKAWEEYLEKSKGRSMARARELYRIYLDKIKQINDA